MILTPTEELSIFGKIITIYNLLPRAERVPHGMCRRDYRTR